MSRQASSLLFFLVLVSATAFGMAAPSKSKHPNSSHKPVTNQSKGQKQIAGGDGTFGTVYSLKDGFNFEVLSARYTVEPLLAQETRMALADKKLVVLDVAVKNARPSDSYYNPDAYVTLVDAQGELYPNSVADMVLASRSDKEAGWTLRPGQGLGQPERHDPLRLGLIIPAKARIVKIMVNQGRLNRNEKVLRYFIAGATEAEAGQAGDPRNVIAPLPDAVWDPADPSGATALGSGKGTAGVFLPTGAFALRLDGLGYTSEPTKDQGPPGDGKKYAVATITVKSLTPKPQTLYDFTDWPSGACTLTDSDGETNNCVGYIKAKSNERPEHDFNQGVEYTFRLVFPLNKEATAKTLTLGAGAYRTWTFPATAASGGNG